MLNIILFDDNFENLKPLTWTKPVGALRIGIMTMQEKWQTIMQASVSFATKVYLSKKYSTTIAEQNLLINASVLPNEEMVDFLKNNLKEDCAWVQGDQVIAIRLDKEKTAAYLAGDYQAQNSEEATMELSRIVYPWDIFRLNGEAIQFDFKLLTKGRISQPLSDTNRVVGDPSQVFVEEGAWVECATFNTQNGPIYIGKDAIVMEGTIARGPFALCEHATTKMDAKIYGPTTIGPHSKVGGEISNSVIIGYSNKGHDGFLGNAVIGEWCNLGADTNCSNLKNNYSEVRVWNYSSKRFHKTGLQFCGLVMGDHSKSGINTMFNTGTVVGAFCNVYGSDFPRKFIPSFSWGSHKGFMIYQLEKALETAERVMIRRKVALDDIEKEILQAVFQQTEEFRNY